MQQKALPTLVPKPVTVHFPRQAACSPLPAQGEGLQGELQNGGTSTLHSEHTLFAVSAAWPERIKRNTFLFIERLLSVHRGGFSGRPLHGR